MSSGRTLARTTVCFFLAEDSDDRDDDDDANIGEDSSNSAVSSGGEIGADNGKLPALWLPVEWSRLMCRDGFQDPFFSDEVCESREFSTDFRRSRLSLRRTPSCTRLALVAASLRSSLSLPTSELRIFLAEIERILELALLPPLPFEEEEEEDINLERLTAL